MLNTRLQLLLLTEATALVALLVQLAAVARISFILIHANSVSVCNTITHCACQTDPTCSCLKYSPNTALQSAHHFPREIQGRNPRQRCAASSANYPSGTGENYSAFSLCVEAAAQLAYIGSK